MGRTTRHALPLLAVLAVVVGVASSAATLGGFEALSQVTILTLADFQEVLEPSRFAWLVEFGQVGRL